MAHYSRKKAILIIAFSTLLVSGSSALSLLFFRLQEVFHSKNEVYNIHSIVQTGPQYGALKTLFLSETLGLSIDAPVNIYSFDIEQATQKLMGTHIIQSVSLKKIKPDILCIDYTLRKPVAKMGSLTNTYVDAQGVLFPAHPFYSPKKIPELIVEGGPQVWGGALNSTRLAQMNGLLKHFEKEEVIRIDLSMVDAPSIGSREIVVMVKQGQSVHTLRLPREGFESAIQNYFQLHKQLLASEKKSTLIDLRLPDMAFLNQ